MESRSKKNIKFYEIYKFRNTNTENVAYKTNQVTKLI